MAGGSKFGRIRQLPHTSLLSTNNLSFLELSVKSELEHLYNIIILNARCCVGELSESDALLGVCVAGRWGESLRNETWSLVLKRVIFR